MFCLIFSPLCEDSTLLFVDEIFKSFRKYKASSLFLCMILFIFLLSYSLIILEYSSFENGILFLIIYSLYNSIPSLTIIPLNFGKKIFHLLLFFIYA